MTDLFAEMDYEYLSEELHSYRNEGIDIVALDYKTFERYCKIIREFMYEGGPEETEPVHHFTWYGIEYRCYE